MKRLLCYIFGHKNIMSCDLGSPNNDKYAVCTYCIRCGKIYTVFSSPIEVKNV